jgi:Magnesium chelatase, subunit ChlI C-terminal
MSTPAPSEPRARVAARVARAREVQIERFLAKRHPELRTNAEAEGELLDLIAEPDAPGRELLLRATERMHLTARLSSGAAGGAHHRRSRRQRGHPPGASGRSALVSPRRASAALKLAELKIDLALQCKMHSCAMQRVIPSQGR